MIQIEGVSKSYQRKLVLDDVSISLTQGQIFGLLGPNGAGKTTLIRMLNQMISPDSGHILYQGKALSPTQLQNIGYLPEERGLYKKMKVGEQCVYLAQMKGMKEKDALAELKMWFEKFEIQEWWDKKVEDLSKGMAQKIQFITTVVHKPKLLILDEPFSGFDPINANMLKDEILGLKERGTSILFSTHRMESVEELCDSIALINQSKVVLTGEKEEVRSRFKKDEYAVKFSGELTNSPAFEVVSVDAEQHSAVIKLAKSDGTNQAISALIKQVDLFEFKEVIPSFNDIFIQVVEETK